MTRLSALLLALTLVACGDDSSATDTGPTMNDAATDTTTPSDAAMIDTAMIDTAMMDDAASPDAATSTPTAEEACDAIDARDVRCSRSVQDRAECIADFACTSFLRADSIGPIVQCETDLACDGNDDACYIASELGLVESAESKTYTTECNARRTECANTFNDDFCFASVASTASLATMTACLAMGCDAIADCLGGVYDAACEG